MAAVAAAITMPVAATPAKRLFRYGRRNAARVHIQGKGARYEIARNFFDPQDEMAGAEPEHHIGEHHHRHRGENQHDRPSIDGEQYRVESVQKRFAQVFGTLRKRGRTVACETCAVPSRL